MFCQAQQVVRKSWQIARKVLLYKNILLIFIIKTVNSLFWWFLWSVLFWFFFNHARWFPWQI